MHRTQKRRGFTLIELSISLVIAGFLLAMVLAMENQKARREKTIENTRKMDAIERALLSYRVRYSMLPCPGGVGLLMETQYFGTSRNSIGSCQSDTNVKMTQSPINDVAVGDVPVRSLGLTDDYAFDAWGRRFRYAVDQGANFTGGTDAVIPRGSIELMDSSGTEVATDEVLAVVLSFGPNGHGGYTRGGNTVNAGSTNTYEQANCFCTSNGVFSSPLPNKGVFHQRAASDDYASSLNSFDDIVRYYPRNFFYTWAEKNQ
jgi:prepilin-type N-terminal cleavage/methylation domain-containing protein